jgi:hypothetical protein
MEVWLSREKFDRPALQQLLKDSRPDRCHRRLTACQLSALTILASPFKSKMRLEAENAVLRDQLIVLRRRRRGRVSAHGQ